MPSPQTAENEPAKPSANLLVPNITPWTAEDGPCIELEGVAKGFGELEVLKDLTMEIVPGEITSILGRSGSGKSVLTKLINGLMRPDAGSVKLFGQDLAQLDAQKLDQYRKRVGTLFQNYALFDSMTVIENVAFPLVENNAMSEDEAHKIAGEMLTDLGLGDVFDEYPSALSGGMKKRVAVARSIIWNPELLLLDDPTTGLDPIMTRFVDNLLIDVTRKYNLTTVMVSHNLQSIFYMSDRILVLHDGRIIASGTPDEIKASDNPDVQSLVGLASRSDIEVQEEEKADTTLERVPDEQAIVRMVNVRKSFGERDILKGVNLTAREHEITVIIGGSGAGKSVMMKHILGLMTADEGQVFLFGKNVADLKEAELQTARTKIGMLFQHSALLDSLNVEQNIAFPVVERREMSVEKAKDRALELLDTLRLKDIATRLPSEISNGQQKRVSLARALISEPILMVYDEPTTGQDPILSDYVEEMIVETQENFDLTSIIISHDMASTMRIADRVALLHLGEIILEGPPAAFLDSDDDRVRDFVFASQH